MPRKKEHRKQRADEAIWKEREERLEELLEKEGENPNAKEDFKQLLEAMAKDSREA